MDCDTSLLRQRYAVENSDLGRSVTHENLVVVGSEAPPFTGIRELSNQMKVAEVVYESNVGSPCELDDSVPDESDTLSKKLWRQGNLLDDLTGFEANFAKRRMAIKSRTFVEEPVSVYEALCERGRVVRESLDDLERVLWRPSRATRLGGLAEAPLWQRREQKRQRKPSTHASHFHTQAVIFASLMDRCQHSATKALA